MLLKSLIFDLGGVIVNLSPEKTLQAFASLSGNTHEHVLVTYTRHPAFQAYETGKMDETEFRDAIREMFHVNASDSEIDAARNPNRKT